MKRQARRSDHPGRSRDRISQPGGRIRILFVTWDGPQSTYLQGLFLPIFSCLESEGYSFHILQFTWGSPSGGGAEPDVAVRSNISYSSVTVLRRPVALGSLITAVWGAWHVFRLAKKHRIDILMPRSILPALSALLARIALPRIKMLFDADGLPVDELIDFAGLPPRSAVAVTLQAIEAEAVRRADAILTRSEEAGRILRARAGPGVAPDKFFRVPNCRDEAQFRPLGLSERMRVRHSLGIPLDAPVIVYAGSSLSGKYCGVSMLRFFDLVAMRQPEARFLILTSAPEEAVELIRRVVPGREARCHIRRVGPEEVPFYLTACDVGIALIKPAPSMKAAAAIKIGEYLLCGLPVVATSGVGDADKVIPPDICFLLESVDRPELDAAADWFTKRVMAEQGKFSEAARKAGLQHYGFDSGIPPYRQALNFVQEPG